MLYHSTTYPLATLVHDIGKGKIGLPELQRPFVWPNAKVRDLFDSLFRGYPCGFLLFWETGVGLKGIGTSGKEDTPSLAIVDGQQRLTALYAVMTGAQVIRSDFSHEHIRIAFDPLAARFEVSNAATAQDKSFIPDISVIWKTGSNAFRVAADFLLALGAVRNLNVEETARIQTAIGRLVALSSHPFNALVLTTEADVETVAEVFVRINGQGAKLNQADFILTLMSVFWDAGRAELEKFSALAAGPSTGSASPKNHFIEPSPDQMLRVVVGLGLKRGKLEAVYALLRGRNPATGMIDPARRAAGFAKLKAAQATALGLANWQYFLSGLPLAGYTSGRLVAGEAAILYAYAIFLIGSTEAGVGKPDMRQAAAEFYFMAAMTSRYGFSAETRFEQDLSALDGATSADEFLTRLRRLSDLRLTEDFWTINLPELLTTSGARAPVRLAYLASLIILDAKALYSPIKVAAALDPAITGVKSAVEQHHLFPRKYLSSIGVSDTKQINQVANLALLEWPANVAIGASPPETYAPDHDMAMTEADRFHHALPPLWWTLPYEEFLVERRRMMAKTIRGAWNRLRGDDQPVHVEPPSIAELIAAGESESVEFKATLRTNLHTGQPDERMHLSALKTLAAFLNAGGGTLLIGVADDGSVTGLAADKFPSEDKLGLHLVNLVRERIGALFLPYIHPEFRDQDGGRVLAVRCERGPKAAFVKDGGEQRFFVRGANATAELSGHAVVDYISQRFK